MKEVDIMLIAIIVYLIIGAIIVLLLRNILADVVKNENLAGKVIYYIAMVVIALPVCTYNFAKGFYREFKNESES
jgi:hypothetical protein